MGPKLTRIVLAVVLGWVLMLAGGGAPALAQGTGCPNADDAARDYNCPLGPGYLIPGLTDLNGWNERAHYRNIFPGDLDADGIDELVVRGTGGVQVFRFDSGAGQWSQVKQTARILADIAGFGARPYYDSIRLGDIDGDGRAELVARGTEGIIVFKYTAKTPDEGAWTQVTTSGPMKDKDCFPGQRYPGGPAPCWGSDPSYYSTIQLTPLGGQGTTPSMQLMGRSGFGLELYKWNGSGWDKLATLDDLSDQKIGRYPIGPSPQGPYYTPKDDRYSSTILSWDTSTVVIRNAHGLQVYKLNGSSFAWQYDPNDVQVFPDPRDASRYSTIQLFRGAGPSGGTNPVVLGRGTAGLQLYNWTGKTWTNLITDGGALPLSDKAGFNKPQYYGTIQAADVNGDGRDEALARGGSGMIVMPLTAAGNGWASPLSTGTPGLADDPWADPAYYTTIKTAKLGKGTARSLIARGPTGVRTWSFDASPGRNVWTRPKPYGLPQFSGDALKAYTAMNSTKVLNLQDGVRSLYADPKADPNQIGMSMALQTLQANCATRSPQLPPYPPSQYASCPAPSGTDVSDEVWTSVTNQIMAELSWALRVVDYFNDLEAIQSTAFIDDSNQLFSIKDNLKLAQAANVTAEVNYLELFEGILDILAVIPEVGEAFEITGAALGIADASTEGVDVPTEFDHTAAEVETDLTAFKQNALAALSIHQHLILRDYGLMSTVGFLRAEGIWSLDKVAAASAHRQAFASWTYGQFLPSLWDSWTVEHCRIYWGCAQAGPMMKYWQAIGEDQDGYNEARFSGFVPRDPKPCGKIHCGWTSLEQQTGWDDTIATLSKPIPASCIYSPGKVGWTFGCPLGGVPDGDFRTFSCDYSDPYECWNKQDQYGVTDVAAGGLGTSRGTVDVSTVTQLKGDLDLSEGTVTFARLLDEDGGAEELVNGLGTLTKAAPTTVRLAPGAKPHSARFVSVPGAKPRIRGTLSVSVRSVSVGTGRKRKTQRVRILRMNAHIDRATLGRPRKCGADATTNLGVHIVVRGRSGRSAQVLGLHPVDCRKGGLLHFSAPRSRGRVSSSRAKVRGGVVSLPVRCHSLGRLRCDGTLALRARLGTRRVVIGTGRFSIQAGRKATVRVRLTARGRKALTAGRGRLAGTAALVTQQPSGLTYGSSRGLVLVR